MDFGSQRIGLAVGVDEPFVATTPQPPLAPTGTLKRDAEAIAALASKLEIDAVVVGVPVNDEDPRMARICAKLIEEIRALGRRVEGVDESMTSVQAEANLRQTGLTAAGRRKLRDGEAARLIVERFFEQKKPA